MRSRMKYTITSREVHNRTASTVQQHLGLTDHGPKCTASLMMTILLYAASRITSVFDACQRLAAASSATVGSKGKLRRGLIPQRTAQPPMVILQSPSCAQAANFRQIGKLLPARQFVTQPVVERLGVALQVIP